MLRRKVYASRCFLCLLLLCLFFISIVHSQTQTSEYNIQGKLQDMGVDANGSYDFETCTLDESNTPLECSQNINVSVIDGAYNYNFLTDDLLWDGAKRFFSISVRRSNSGDAFTVLSPPQDVASVPYATLSKTATKTDSLSDVCVIDTCVKNEFIETVDGSKITGQVPTGSLPTDSGSYIQNTQAQQSGSNFNISGTGTADIFNAATQYNIGGNRVIAVTSLLGNTFVGIDSGSANTGGSNSFFGRSAGVSNMEGNRNSFFGSSVGQLNTTGSDNSFFGNSAGVSNTEGNFNSFFGNDAGKFGQSSGSSFFGFSAGESNTANYNSFFGYQAGKLNTSGSSNSFFGQSAGLNNTTADNNSFFGSSAGRFNTASGNSFFGTAAGLLNTTGSSNSFFGALAGENNNASDNSFFGFQAGILNTSGSNNSFFGQLAGSKNETANSNSFFGSAAGENNTGRSNSFFGDRAGQNNGSGFENSFFGADAGRGDFTNGSGFKNSFFGWEAGKFTTGSSNTFIGHFAGNQNSGGTSNVFVGLSAGLANILGSNNTVIGTQSNVGSPNLFFATAIGSGAVVTTSNTIVLGRNSDTTEVSGAFRINTLGGGGATQLCLNAGNIVGSCSSSLRYKSNIEDFRSGIDLIKRLRPVSFNWKEGGTLDVGLVAEEVAEIEPLLTTNNKDGQVEGVKYDRVGVVLINAVNEQQEQIKEQARQNQILKTQIEQQKKQIDEQKVIIDGLLKIVCSQNLNAEVCTVGEKENEK